MDDPRRVIAQIVRQDRGRVLSALVATLRDFDLAEESLAEALESAVVHWGRAGVPENPRAWLMRVARRKAIDRIRRKTRFADRVKDLEMLAEADQQASSADPPEIPDERLAMIFTCCHPALDPKSRVALTLRTLFGLTTAEVARAFGDSETTMGQRLSRAKAKIARAGIAYAVPGPELWPDRLESVLTVVYLIFNQCYSSGVVLVERTDDLCAEAVHLSRMLRRMLPEEDEVAGLLALLLLIEARRAARTDAEGRSVPIQEQDAALWHRDRLDEGLALIDLLGPVETAGIDGLQARIAAEHMRRGPGGTDWRRVLDHYHRLLALLPTAVVELNLAVALGEVHGPAFALRTLDALAPELESYQPYHATRAEFLARAGRSGDARAAYDRAIMMTASSGDAAFLRARRDALPG